MSWEFERVAGPYGFTEGPVWDGGGVLFTDIPNDRVMRYDVDTEECTVRHTGTGAANGLKLDADGALYACEMNGRRVGRYADGGGDGDPDADGYEVVVDRYGGARFNSPNDLAIDDEGTVWFTDPFYDADWEPADKRLELDHRSVYRVDPEAPETLTRVTHDTTNPNGLLVSPDGATLYVAQSDYDGARELRAYPIAPDGSAGDYEVLHDFGPHRGIDGMCLDAEGNVVATAGAAESGPGPLIYVFTPSGRVLETHPTPDPRPTNCCFGGDDLATLYVTGSDGCLYRAATDRTGLLGAP
jgi:gluconolactonase